MELSTPLISAAIALAFLIIFIFAYSFSSRVRFWLFHFFMGVPVVGRIALHYSRLDVPTTDEANDRLDDVFQAYHGWIEAPISEERFSRYREYLFLSGDSDTHPAPPIYFLGIFLLLAAEAYSYSFLFGSALSAEASEIQVDRIAMAITFVFAGVFALLSHVSGKAIRRTYALRRAWRNAIDKSRKLPADEKSIGDLISLISMDADQNRDKSLLGAYDAQRQLNRIRKDALDRGGYLFPVAFVVAVLIMAIVQFEMRALSDFTTNTVAFVTQVDLPDLAVTAPQQQALSTTANLFFVLIFVLTQLVALWFGYTHTFLGHESRRAYGEIKGSGGYESFSRTYRNRVRCADKSLTKLLAAFEQYEDVQPDTALYEKRARKSSPASGEALDQPSGGDGGDTNAASKQNHPAGETQRGGQKTILPFGRTNGAPKK